MARNDRDRFTESCLTFKQYPKNVIKHSSYKYILNTLQSQLSKRTDVLFCKDGKAAVDVLEYRNGEFEPCRIHREFEMRCILEGENLFDNIDPKCRYIFIHALHSRDHLKISESMFKYVFTYFQVMPSFLDFIFPFGFQESQEDFHFTGFRQQTRLLEVEKGLNIPELGRSGLETQICYALKSIEQSNDPAFPWSIRQTATYHSFDFGSWNSLWIIVKGNLLMKDRVSDSSDDKDDKDVFKTLGSAFSVSLDQHLMICSWCAEEWRWYVNFMDSTLQKMTRRSLAIRVVKTPSILAEEEKIHAGPLKPARNRTISWTSLKANSSKKTPTFFLRPDPALPTYELHPQDSQFLAQPPHPPPPPGIAEEVSMGDLQELQHLEDKVNEASLVLKANKKVLSEIRSHYQIIVGSYKIDAVEKAELEDLVVKFSNSIESILSDLDTHCSRIDTLLRMIADRKSLLYGILNYRAMDASRILAKRAQESAKRMEDMTNEMSDVARKTKQETVSMKVITLVTLFFLPGTFMSTIMSTDIIHFDTNDGKKTRTFEIGALLLWIEVTIPLIVLTFTGWWIFYKQVDRDVDARKQRAQESRI